MQLGHEHRHRYCWFLYPAVKVKCLNYLSMSEDKCSASVFSSLLYLTSSGFFVETRFCRNLFIKGPITVSSTVHIFASSVILFTVNK